MSDLSDEEKKAIEMLKNQKEEVDEALIAMEIPENYIGEDVEQEYLEWQKNAKTILNLIQKQEKVIDEMASIFLKTYRDWEVIRYIFQYHICSKLQNPESEESDCYANIWNEQSCRDCIKQYFYRKVENNE